LPSNTITNPKEDLKGITTRSGVAYQGPIIPTLSKQGTEVTKDQVQTPNSQSTAPVEPLVVRTETQTPVSEPVVAPVSVPMPNLKPSILYPSRRMDECLALADLGASINLMPLSVWEGLLLPELTPTCMTHELADRSVSKPIGIAKDVSVKVEYSQEVLGFSDITASGNPTPYDDLIVSTTSHTLTLFGDSDFLLFEEADAFLELKVCEAKTVKSSVDEPPEVKLKDLPPHLEYAFLEGNNKLPIIIAKELGDEEKSAMIKILMEEDYKPAVQHQRRVNPKIHDVIKKEVEKLLDAGLIYPISNSPWVSPVHCVPKKGGFTVVENKENELILTRLVIEWRVCIDYRKLNEATRKDHFSLSFMDQMLKRLAGNEIYCFLDGFSGYFQIPIDPRDLNVHLSLWNVCLSTHAFRFVQCTGHVSKMLKKKLTKAPILIASNWDLPFELMCDASDFAIGAILGQRPEKHFKPIHYASKTMNNVESNYTTTEKEMLAVVIARIVKFSCSQFCPSFTRASHPQLHF
nr:reverse transcriptase domain-containing protein [Tanacetum cinerariifolium]